LTIGDSVKNARDTHATATAQMVAHVLAGGASSRFGKDKALVKLGGKPMLARMLDLLAAVPLPDVAIVGSAEKYGHFGTPCIADRWPGEGPLGGILSAMLHTRETKPGCQWNLILSCDMPFLTRDWIAHLVKHGEKSEADVVLPHSASGPEPLCACYRTEVVEPLVRVFENGVRKITQALQQVAVEVLDERDWKRFDTAGRLFWNMNTPADYEEARKILETEHG
jgi:molybdopterin-guanine dinucleotide biosynthesis protein A